MAKYFEWIIKNIIILQITLTVTLTLSGHVATRLRDYAAKPNSNSNSNWLRGYAATWLRS